MIILEIVGYILLGVATIIGAVFGAAYLLTREIMRGGHGPQCSCPGCQQKRHAQWKARHGDDSPVIPTANKDRRGDQKWKVDDKKSTLPPGGTWISTLELQAGMTVIGRSGGKIYVVDGVLTRPYGFLITLSNKLTGAKSMVTVKGDAAQNRIWYIRKRNGRG